MRLIDADELLKHEIEADRMGAMLVVGKGYILSAPEVDAMPVVYEKWKAPKKIKELQRWVNAKAAFMSCKRFGDYTA